MNTVNIAIFDILDVSDSLEIVRFKRNVDGGKSECASPLYFHTAVIFQKEKKDTSSIQWQYQSHT